MSNRGHDSITTLSVSPNDGTLSFIASTPSAGFNPRNFILLDDGFTLVVANQNSQERDSGGNIVCFDVNVVSGALTACESATAMSLPVCVLTQKSAFGS